MKLKNPNFNDPRVRRRMELALGWVLTQMSVEEKPKPLYSRDIGAPNALGPLNQSLPRWLKYHLLTCVNDAYSMDRGTCKTYILNLEGTRMVAEILGYNVFTGLSKDLEKLQMQLGVEYMHKHFDIDNIQYREVSNRYWNKIQNIRRTTRNKFLSDNGLTEQYDIQCAAQSLIYQTYLMHTDKRLMMIENYITNRSDIRKKIANDVDISVSNVKQLLTAMNNNSRLQAHMRCETYHLADYSPRKVHLFNNHPSVVYLKAETSQMWKELGKHMVRETTTTSNGTTRKVNLNGSSKSQLYFSLEKQVMDVAYAYLDSINKKYIRLHDAFVTQPISQSDVTQITNQIKSITGYDVILDKSVIN
jgi:hypothetical protein